MIDRALIKISVLGGLNLILAAFFSYEFTAAIALPELKRLLFIFIILIVWLALFALQTFLIHSPRLVLGLTALQGVAVWLFLNQKFAALPIAAAAVLILFLTMGMLSGRAQLRNSLKIRFLRVSHRATAIALTGLSFFAVLYLLGVLDFTEPATAKNVLKFLLQGSEPIVSKFVPGFSLEAPVIEVVESFARSELPAGTPASLVDQAADDLLKNLSNRFGIVIRGQDTVIDAIIAASLPKLTDLGPAYQTLTLAAIGLVFFGFFKFLAFFLNLIIIILSALIYKLLLVTGFMYITLENQSKEVIVVN